MEIIQKDRTYLIRVREIGDIWAIGSQMEIKDNILLLDEFTIKRKYDTYRNGDVLIDVFYGEKIPSQVMFPIPNLIGITLLDKNKRPLWARDLNVAKTLFDRAEQKRNRFLNLEKQKVLNTSLYRRFLNWFRKNILEI